jgi:hypothetical protein
MAVSPYSTHLNNVIQEQVCNFKIRLETNELNGITHLERHERVHKFGLKPKNFRIVHNRLSLRSSGYVRVDDQQVSKPSSLLVVSERHPIAAESRACLTPKL